jgi:hypothetical protein
MRNLIAVLVFCAIGLPFMISGQNKNGSIRVPDTLDAPYINYRR